MAMSQVPVRVGFWALGLSAIVLVAVVGATVSAACSGRARPAPAQALPEASASRERAASSAAPELALPPASGSSGSPTTVGIPNDASAPGAIRRFLLANPHHERARHLAKAHDRKLLPCPGGRVRCSPSARVIALGVLERADRYLAQCLVCRYRDGVTATRRRARVVVDARLLDEARARFDAALVGRDFAEAAQAVADIGKRAPVWWRRDSEARLRRRGQGALLDVECRVPDELAVLTSPARAVTGAPVRALVVSETEQPGPIAVEVAPLDGAPLGLDARRKGGGPPHYWSAELRAPKPGHYVVRLAGAGETVACRRLTVHAEPARNSQRPAGPLRGWDRAAENLYSAFVELLFDAREGKRWKGLHAVTRDRRRNILFNHLGLSEDTEGAFSALELEPDCADNPYFLRAYFAWKLGLPFGHHDCRFESDAGLPQCRCWRLGDDPNEGADSDPECAGDELVGDAGATPHAAAPAGAEADSPPKSSPPHPARRFARYLRRLKNEVRARSLRTGLSDDRSDLYPVALTRQKLRPGTVFSDPHGHTMTVVKWLPQTEKRDGLMLAVDAQPDGHLGIKRFWRGTFLFAGAPAARGYGFKAFRPIALDHDELRLLANYEIAVADGYGGVSYEQAKMSAAEFYRTMGSLINPQPLPPEREYRQLHEALVEQLRSRVKEVQVAEELMAERDNEILPMPDGRAIFHTTGPWEALSTPCRDMRLLVGIDVLLDYPEQAATQGASRADLERLHARWSAELSIAYERSDGSKHRLTLSEIIARRTSFEMAYNPNDCPEARWGAAEGSAELETCSRRASPEQRRKMDRYRHWFVKRYACG